MIIMIFFAFKVKSISKKLNFKLDILLKFVMQFTPFVKQI